MNNLYVDGHIGLMFGPKMSFAVTVLAIVGAATIFDKAKKVVRQAEEWYNEGASAENKL